MPPDRLRSIVSMFGGGAHYVEILDAICQHDVEIVFGHPNPSIYEANYLVPIPAADEAFESGVTVATSRELHDAASDTRCSALRFSARNRITPNRSTIYPFLS